MDITACVSASCNERHSCLRYMGVRGERQSYSDLQLFSACNKLDIHSGSRIMTAEDADAHNAPLHEDWIAEAIDSLP